MREVVRSNNVYRWAGSMLLDAARLIKRGAPWEASPKAPDIMPARQRFEASGVTCVSTRLGPNAQCEITQGVRIVCGASRRLIASQAT